MATVSVFDSGPGWRKWTAWVVGAGLSIGLFTGCSLVGDADDGSQPETTSAGSSGGEAAADSGLDDDQGRPGEQPLVAFEPVFSAEECIESLPDSYEVECGTVEVPMNWETGQGTISLAVVVFAAQDGAGGDNAPPVIYLEGGPGGHALDVLQFTAPDLLDPLLPTRDVVVFDQRGAGLSEPQLTCDEVTAASRQLEDTAMISDEESDRQFLDALTRCRQRLEADGIELASFNTRFNARDVEAIRQALGYEQVSLLGVSYGTKLGLEVLRRHPESVSAAVLDSVYPPEVDSVAENGQTFVESYQKMVSACSDEPGCRTGGDLASRLTDLAAQLQAEPIEIEIEDWIEGSTDTVYLTGDTLVGIVTQSLYSPQMFTDLPELVEDLEQGRFDIVEQYLSQYRTTERFFTDGMFYAFACREEVSFADPSTVVDPPDPFGLRPEFDLASNVGSNAFATCQAFDNGSAPALANEPVQSDVPTLLLAGDFDPVTPVKWAEDAAENLTNAQVVVAPHESHGVSAGACGMSIIAGFLATPEATVDATCVNERPWAFIDTPQASLPLTEASFLSQGFTVTTARPESWSVGVLEGDQYRRLSFLDPTQLHQLAGDEDLGAALQQFIEDSNDVQLGPPEPFGPTSALGPMLGAELNDEWTRRQAKGTDVVVEWFERPTTGATLYVILVASETERDSLVEAVLEPALSAIEISNEGE